PLPETKPPATANPAPEYRGAGVPTAGPGPRAFPAPRHRTPQPSHSRTLSTRHLMHHVTRRSFLKSTAALGAASFALPSAFAQLAPAPRKLKCGHTGITWGYRPEAAAQAIKDVAALG